MTTEEVITKIVRGLEGCSGETIADIANLLLMNEIKYVGDGFFEYKDERK